MGIFKTWVASSSPVVKMFMAISVTSMLAVGHKMFLAPYLNRQRHLQAEEWANMILEQEETYNNSSK